MASAMRKMGVYLGLVEDDSRFTDGYDSYEEYDEYDETVDVVDTVVPVAARADYGAYATDHRVEAIPPQQVELARITTLHPRTYNEARTIGGHFRGATPG